MNEIAKIFLEEGSKLNLWEVGIRTVIIFFTLLILIKVGKRKLLGKNTALDFILAVIIGSVLSRSINGSSDLLSAAAAGVVLILLHWTFSYLAIKSNTIHKFVNGLPYPLIKNGIILNESLRKQHLKNEDILEAARYHAHISDIGRIRESYFESNGGISIVKEEN